MRKALNLQQIINLQATVEKMITDSLDIILHNNAYTDSETTVDVIIEYERLDKLLNQLNELKTAKDAANKKKTLFGKSNQDRIFELSNLKRKKDLLETLYNQKLKNRKGKQVEIWKFQLSKSKIDSDLQKVETKIADIKESMTNFNKSTKVKVNIDDDLKLL